MYFNKIRHPANFAFNTKASTNGQVLTVAGKSCELAIASLGGDTHRITLAHPRWAPHGSDAELAAAIPGDDAFAVKVDAHGDLAVVETATGRTLLQGARRATFGVSGPAWMFQFRHHAGMQFYGLGEHNKGLEKSGQRVKFWNTDVYGDYAQCEARHGHPASMYISIPYVIVKQDNDYVGLLINNPGAVFMDLASDFLWDGKNLADRQRQSFYLGAPDGQPELYVIVGPTLPELTRKMQTLVGRTPLPPLWALGYHQCRWGYAGPKDLHELDRKFREHGIPCDALWLDIDYMDAYKVFTFSPGHWKNEANVRRELAKLLKRGRRVVPILDPGVAVDYPVYDSGRREGIFCLTPEGEPFTGFVWPGRTHFPDFSLPAGQAWWAAQVKRFAETGVGGAWLDMNDPSIGAVELDEMRFRRGTKPHEFYHNQYALGMARASRAGFLAAQPDRRPFLLTRSAFLSSSRHAAAWTGDNFSNWHHLRGTIPLSVGLALSGLPFNGPDVAGFLDDTTPELATAWFKTCFLFPFMRNHSMTGSRRQEPWALGGPARRTIGHYIRLRYKLLPYLYQLFVAQAETGEAILRPLFYDFADTSRLPLGRIADQFLVGPSILQAPVIEEGATTRKVTLPGDQHWFDAATGQWLPGNRTISVSADTDSTPLYVREGALIPMQAGERTDNANEFNRIELHCFLRPDTQGTSQLDYVFDDGESFAYQQGKRTRCRLSCAVGKGGVLDVQVAGCEIGYKALRLSFVVYANFARVDLTVAGKTRSLALRNYRWRFAGKPLVGQQTAWIQIG